MQKKVTNSLKPINSIFIASFYSHFTGKSIWEKYKDLKSLLLDHENPHFRYKSGDELINALQRAKNNLLVYKQNKLITATNKRQG